MAHFAPPPPLDDPEAVWSHFLRALPIIGPVFIFLSGCLWFVVSKMAGNLFKRYEELIAQADRISADLTKVSQSLAVKGTEISAIQADIKTLDAGQLDHETRISHVEGKCEQFHGRKH